MRIVFVCENMRNFGGVERILTDKINYFADSMGYEVFLLTSTQHGFPFVFDISQKVKCIDLNVDTYIVYKYKYPKRLYVALKEKGHFLKALQKAIDSISPDIVIGTTYFRAVDICRLHTSAKIVIESHVARSHMAESGRSSLRQLWDNLTFQRDCRFIERHSDYIVTLTNGDRKEWKVDDKRIKVIPNVTRCDHGYMSDMSSHRAICVGRFRYEKGFDRVIKAWKHVYIKHKDWTLDIFGKGNQEFQLKELIEKNGLSDVVRLNPVTKNVYAEYSKSSIFVLPSRYEGFGLVLVEAMTCGLPCVSFDCPYGPVGIIKDKEDGLLVENGNIGALADAICWMIEHDEECKEMGRKARENVKRFSPEVVMAQWNEFFKSIVKE